MLREYASRRHRSEYPSHARLYALRRTFIKNAAWPVVVDLDIRAIPRQNREARSLSKGVSHRALSVLWFGRCPFHERRERVLSGLRRIMVSLRFEPVEIMSIGHSEISSRYWR